MDLVGETGSGRPNPSSAPSKGYPIEEPPDIARPASVSYDEVVLGEL